MVHGRRETVGRAIAIGILGAVSVLPRAAEAFCGFYVGSADASLYNHATQVVLMRDGTRTVLSMRNTYQGPPQGFAMVVPVPIVLQKENVKTLRGGSATRWLTTRMLLSRPIWM